VKQEPLVTRFGQANRPERQSQLWAIFFEKIGNLGYYTNVIAIICAGIYVYTFITSIFLPIFGRKILRKYYIDPSGWARVSER
jgi:hypothetical protein